MPLFLGIDFGTGGARACVISPEGEVDALEQVDFGQPPEHELASTWREALWSVVAHLPAGSRRKIAALALDGTSGTLLACNEALESTYPPLPYHDARAVEEAARIARAAGSDHPAAAPTSGLAKMLWFKSRLGLERARLYLNQADWLTGLISGRVGISDYHNALKLGFDAEAGRWPDWVEFLADVDYLPNVVPPGAPIATVDRPRARQLGLSLDCLVRTGTTDSIAAFLAAGARETGDAVTSLGTTLVIKLISDRRLESAEYGIYSHWFGDRWLAGGASNCGGGTLRRFFEDGEIAVLSREIDPSQDSGLDYYPLPEPGERFPIHDPRLQPRLEPRPADRRQFLHGLLDGLARVEALGYERLHELGAPRPARVLSAGGGAVNPTLERLRQRHLEVPVSAARHQEAAYGAALLARDGTPLFAGRNHD